MLDKDLKELRHSSGVKMLNLRWKYVTMINSKSENPANIVTEGVPYEDLVI